MEKRFMDLDGQEQRVPLDEDMELEYAFDMEEDTPEPFAAGESGMPETLAAGKGGITGVPSAEDMGIPESFVIGDDRAAKPLAAGNARKQETMPESREKKPPAGREDKAADSISYRMFHWKFTVEQKEEVKRAMAVRVPKEVILSYFYPETPVARMMEIRRRYE